MKQQDQGDQEFAFIKEKIKDKPINKRRLLLRTVYNLLCAVLFGVTACFVFVFLKPYIEEWLYPEKEATITIPKDIVPQELEPAPKKEEEEEEPEPEKSGSQTVVVREQLEPEDYQELQNKL